MTLQLLSFLDASSVKRGSYLLRSGNLVKNLPTLGGRLSKKTGGNWEHFSPVGKLMSLKGLCLWWKTSPPSYRRLKKENRRRESIDEKPPELDEKMWEENRKIVDIVDEQKSWWEEGLGW